MNLSRFILISNIPLRKKFYFSLKSLLVSIRLMNKFIEFFKIFSGSESIFNNKKQHLINSVLMTHENVLTSHENAWFSFNLTGNQPEIDF